MACAIVLAGAFAANASTPAAGAVHFADNNTTITPTPTPMPVLIPIYVPVYPVHPGNGHHGHPGHGNPGHHDRDHGHHGSDA